MTESVGHAESVSVWHNRRFLRFWAGNTISQFGDQITGLAFPLIATITLQASATAVAALTAALWIPNLFALPIGTWVDHHPNKRRVLITAELIQAGAIATVPIEHALGLVTMPLLYTSAVLLGAGGVLGGTASQPFFVRLVARHQYIQANSLQSTTQSASGIAGPAIGGLLIAALTAPAAMIIDAVSFLVSATAITTIAIPPSPPDTATESFLRRLTNGTRYLFHQPYLRVSLGCSTTMNFAAFVIQALLVLYASRYLHLSAGLIGTALGLGATGGLAGAITAARLAREIGTGWTIATGAALSCAPFAVLSVAGILVGHKVGLVVLLAVIEFVSSLGIMWFDINNNAVRTIVTEDAMRSRVSGAYSTINYGIRPVGAIIGGLFATHIGLPATLIGAATLGTAAILWLIPTATRIRAIDRL
ncbi:MFS transporter [Microlunatus endophyticus]|uniref:MFS transporter n=1 Tax=Microlunatus endophyticus TaxID=1716077 RepID=A0A917SGR1_9ACTN|nr:MFS transporter [Microlunatus endophyticus]GGL79032.1 MFS transporter [Microlunatus endophyticus]